MRYSLLILIALIWGSQYIFNATALQELTPFGLMSLRIFFGFITLTLFIWVIPQERHYHLTLTTELFMLFLSIGAVEAAIPFFLIAYGQLHVESSITAIIMGLIPMMTLLLEYFLKNRDGIRPKEIAGLAIGFFAVIVLVNPLATVSHVSVQGTIAIVTAAFCFALALILMAKIPKEISALHATRFILLIYTLPLFGIWLYVTPNIAQLSLTTWESSMVLGTFSSGVVYLLYLKLIRMEGAGFTALSNYLVPLVGTLSGVYLLQEPFTPNILLALALMTIALFLLKKLH